MHEKRFHGHATMLRSPERFARLEVERVVRLSLQGLPVVDSVLDVGTGSGLFAEAFAAQVPQVVGLDASAEMVALAQKLVPGATFQQGVMESLPFPDQSFDLVFLGHVLHETDDLPQTLREVRRCARRRVAALEWPYADEAMGPPLAHRLPSQRVMALAGQMGFETVEVMSLTHMTLYRFSLGTSPNKSADGEA
ncbi:MAG: class I SAM-dependent methyltransferase [Chloroflexi bacterium]|nr:class I SAM-dependent methyltransferase [Chloroflexota bacterium]